MNWEPAGPNNTPFPYTGYKFREWNTAGNGSGTPYAMKAAVRDLTDEPDGVFPLYAQWEPVTYTVVFDPNEGAGEVQTQSFTFDSAQKLNANSFSRDGFSFLGWNTAANGSGTGYNDGQEVINLLDQDGASLRLYARWTTGTVHTVTFNANDGSGRTATQNAEEGVPTPLTPNSFTREAYTFAGWNTDPDGDGEAYADGAPVTLSADQDLFAQWTPVIYTITYHLGGGTAEGNPVEYSAASPGITLNPPTRTGYRFEGWQGTGVSGTQLSVTIPSGSSGNREYTAILKPNCYEVVFFFIEMGGSPFQAGSFLYDQFQPLPSNPFTKLGFNFLGWNTAEDGSGTSYEDRQTVGNLTDQEGGVVFLFAQWTQNTVRTVTFYANDGSGLTVRQSVAEGVPTSLKANSFTREGFSFDGWNTDPDGNGVSYADKDPVTLSADLTLYAQWAPPAGGYVTTAGEGQTAVLSENKDAVFIVERTQNDELTFSLFRGIRVDGVSVDPVNFTAGEGSVKIALKAEFLKTLSPGPHVLTVIFKDAEYDIHFSTVRDKKPAEAMKLKVTLNNFTNTGAKGVPAEVPPVRLQASILIKDGSKVISRADNVLWSLSPGTFQLTADVSFDRKVDDLSAGVHTVVIEGLPAFVTGIPNSGLRFALSRDAWINNKGGITVYLKWDDGSRSEPEIIRVYSLPEDEVGAYTIRDDGTKEYLIFHTFDICMHYLGSSELCAGYERCFHKEDPFVNPLVKGGELIGEIVSGN